MKVTNMPTMARSNAFTNWQQSVGQRAAQEPPHNEHEKMLQRSDNIGSVKIPRVKVVLPQAATTILAVISVLSVLTFAKSVAMPVVLALILYLVLRPVMTIFHRWHLPPVVGATICLFVIIGAFAAAMMNLTGPIKDWIANAPEYLNQIEMKLSGVEKQIEDMEQASAKIKEIAKPDEADEPVPVAIQQPKLFPGVEIVSNSGGLVAGTVITLGLLFFLLVYGHTTISNLIAGFEITSSKAKAKDLIEDLQHGMSLYLFTVTVINVSLGIITGLAMYLLGLPNAFLVGVMAALFNFIPFLGAWTGTAIVFFIAILQPFSIGYACVFPAVYFGLTSLEGQFVTPFLLGRSMSLNPLIVFLFLAIWGWMWGIGGVFLAVPILAVLKIIADYFPSMRLFSQAMKC
ncbi:AI-2 transport protein TqsA [Rubinisphaera italica]|uniref:AI-2 transport protein TqsA n=2 Tax=Rubinisphaera italica TaxID=2527969 RepID=A0A5C5XF21_9PLAN|nr:AI-2 transport protein TqsA [Rubinisphaera italica]